MIKIFNLMFMPGGIPLCEVHDDLFVSSLIFGVVLRQEFFEKVEDESLHPCKVCDLIKKVPWKAEIKSLACVDCGDTCTSFWVSREGTFAVCKKHKISVGKGIYIKIGFASLKEFSLAELKKIRDELKSAHEDMTVRLADKGV